MHRASRILYANALRVLRASARRAGWVQRGVAAASLALFLGLVATSFLFFHRTFDALLSDRLAGALIVKYLLESAFLMVFFLAVVSFVTTSVRAAFRSDEVALLARFPIDPVDLFLYRFNGAALLAAWPVLLVALPALIALGVVSGAGPLYYLSAAGTLAVFSAFTSLCGAVLAFAVVAVGRRLPRGIFVLAEAAAVVAVGVGLIRRIADRRFFREFFLTFDAAEISRRFDDLRAVFGVFPSHPFVELLSVALPGATNEASIHGAALTLAGSFVALAFVLRAIVRRWYHPLQQSLRETGFVARPEDVVPRPHRRVFPAVFKWGHSFLFEKEFLMLVRDPAELSRAGIMVLMMLLYVLVMRGVATVERFDGTTMHATLVAAAFFAIGYFAATLGMRFVYPSLSLEGRNAWILWVSPVHNHEFFSWKAFFWIAAALALALPVGFLTVAVFGLAFPVAAFLIFSLVCTAVTVVMVTLGQGTMYPSFEDRDPDSLSTTPAGLTATVICLGYIWILARYVHAYTLAYDIKGAVSVMPFFGVLIVTIAVVGAYAVIAPRKMDALEFPR
jgi:ABC-2 type transport system permease protein